MSKSVEEIAKLLGANVVCRLPNHGGGAFAAAHMAAFYRERMAKLRSEWALPAIGATAASTVPVTLQPATYQKLEAIASESQTSPANVATDIVEQFIKLMESEHGRQTLMEAMKTK